MACNQTLAGLAKDCATSMGGIVKVWMANYDEVTTKTLSEGVISAIEPIESAWKAYNFKKGTGSMTSTLNVDAANGVNYVTTDLTLAFLRMETTKRLEMSALAVNELAVVVEDANGNMFFLGYNEPVTATAGTGETGTARGDGNRYTITLQDTSETFPYQLSAELAASFKAIA